MKTIEYNVPMRTKIIYAPIGLMTSRNIWQMCNQYLLERASFFCDNMLQIFNNLYGSKKAVVHCGNIGRHGECMDMYLEGRGFKTILHEKGKLKQTVEKFLEGDAQILLVVSAEYGMDFKNIDLQFILKVPYAAMDERLKALEKEIGKEEFKEWYSMDAMNRLVQQCGRVGRGANSFGITFILDSKFLSLYEKYQDKLPGWFKERMMMGI